MTRVVLCTKVNLHEHAVILVLPVSEPSSKADTHEQGRNEVRCRPGKEASLASSCSNLRSFRSKFTVLKKVLVTLLGLFGAPIVIWRPGNCAYLALPPLRPCPRMCRLPKIFERGFSMTSIVVFIPH